MATMIENLRRGMRIRATRRELSRLTDAQLHDIGMHRGQIASFARDTKFNSN